MAAGWTAREAGQGCALAIELPEQAGRPNRSKLEVVEIGGFPTGRVILADEKFAALRLSDHYLVEILFHHGRGPSISWGRSPARGIPDPGFGKALGLDLDIAGFLRDGAATGQVTFYIDGLPLDTFPTGIAPDALASFRACSARYRPSSLPDPFAGR